MSHAASPDLIKRLRRANGHLAGIIRMVGERDDGLKTAQQMQAVVAALETKTLIVTDHIEHHLEALVGPLPGGVRAELAQLGQLAKYL